MNFTRSTSVEPKTLCYHCGDACAEQHVEFDHKNFCCHGCQMVYEIINQSGLCTYYDLAENPGISQKIKVRDGKFAFLDNVDIAQKLVHFSEGSQRHVIFYLPQMHCSSCIWLLEQLPRLNPGILRSTTDFLKKDVTLIFDANKTNLRSIAELLTRVGYEPHISLHDLDSKKVKKHDRSRIYKIGIAGFCFGNIMLLSFPEYLASVDTPELPLKRMFSILNLILALPVFFYCATEFYTSAWKGLRQKFLNIDAPIVLAILITFGRSLFEILSSTGAGYLDSMSGIVFFMLVGRYFQDRTYQSLSFSRDYTSYFPISVTAIREGLEKQIPLSDLRKGDRIRVHSHEIVPADSILFLGKANIDYSFVTGESLPVEKSIGEIIYAGGKQLGASIELEVVKEVSQSYLTRLWNNDAFKKEKEERRVSFVHQTSRYFTYILFSIVITAATYWALHDQQKVWDAVTAALIVACPCALLLSATFTNGNMLSKLQQAGLYVKNASALEALGDIDTVVFDKTGTLSLQKQAQVHYEGRPLVPSEIQLVRSLAAQSNHPLSRSLLAYLPVIRLLNVKHYAEEKGRGSRGILEGVEVKLGSEEFVTGTRNSTANGGSRVYVSINGSVIGHFRFESQYRSGLANLVKTLGRRFKLIVLSGDNNSEENYLRQFFGNQATMRFDQTPAQKLECIRTLKQEGHRLLMVGDGLNDAGALQESQVGIAVSDDMNNFSPGCDAILEGKHFASLDRILGYCAKQKRIIYGSFIISILYNVVGLYFAVSAQMAPVIAAILMPASTVSIVLYTTLTSSALARSIKR